MKPNLACGTRRDNRGRQALALVALLLLMLGTMGAAKCGDFERGVWVGLRDVDAALESMTRDYERWRDESPRTFSAAELENLRASLFAANEALAAGQASFDTYWNVKKLVVEGKKAPTDLEAAKRNLIAASDAAKRALAAARAFWSALSVKRAPVQKAGLDFAMLLILLGNLASAFLSGKTKAITEAALELVAAVMVAHEEATGEDIEVALPRLRARIEERRRRLAPKGSGPAATEG